MRSHDKRKREDRTYHVFEVCTGAFSLVGEEGLQDQGHVDFFILVHSFASRGGLVAAG